VIATHLADASAWAQLHRNDVAARLVPLLVGGGAATCGIVDLQVIATFDDDAVRADVATERTAFPRVPVDDAVLDRAVEVLALLPGADVGVLALVVAAAAERAGLVLLHQDDVYDRIAAVTGQPTERAAP
jgi:predicted nucleic acid-binding protein